MRVSRSGYYEFIDKLSTLDFLSSSYISLVIKIRAIFKTSGYTYGTRRIRAGLKRQDISCSRKTIARIMADYSLVARPQRAFKKTTNPGDSCNIGDLVKRDFSSDTPGKKLVGDITYIRTTNGWLYLATVIDCYSKRVIGWAIDNNMRTSLIIKAMKMAIGRVKIIPGKTVFHSDRGSQYLSRAYGEFLSYVGICQSVGRTGTAHDNALAESFFSFLKNECIYQNKILDSKETRAIVAKYIEVFYNSKRLHSSLGYRTPLKAEFYYYQSIFRRS